MPAQCDACAIRKTSICRDVGPEVLSDLAATARRVEFQPGQAVHLDGQAWARFANILAGVVKIVHPSAAGKEQILGLLYPGDFLGRPFAGASEHVFQALTPVTLCSYPKARFEALLERCSELQRALLDRSLDEIDALRRWMTLLGHKKAGEKVASFLIMLADRLGEPADDPTALRLELPMTRAEMADVLGLTVETVSRQMTRLRSDGIIETAGPRCVLIRDPARLSDRAEAA
ncbi:MAG: Crp/Fnr family transcriptional regulator [Rhodothalassiaceae bacterium]